jgi:hypothetical protein
LRISARNFMYRSAFAFFFFFFGGKGGRLPTYLGRYTS